MMIKMRSEVQCGHCDATHVEEYAHYQGNVQRNHCLPADWRSVDGVPVCPRHEIVVRDKTAPVSISFTGIDVEQFTTKVLAAFHEQMKMAMPAPSSAESGRSRFLRDAAMVGL